MNIMKCIAVLILVSIAGQMIAAPVSFELNLRERIDSFVDKRKEAREEVAEGGAVPTMREMWDSNTSYNQGRIAGKKHTSAGWFAGGVVSGFLLGLIGTAIITIAAGGSEPQVIPEQADMYSYDRGYRASSKSRNRKAALGGGLLGTAIIVAIFMMAPMDEGEE